jgi:hypothetical protein
VAPSDYSDTGKQDLSLFAGWTPQFLPAGSLLFINAVPPLEGATAGPDLHDPPVLAKDSEHPLMRFLNMSNVRISKAKKFILPPGSRTILSSTAAPLIADLSRSGQQIAVIAFDLADSNWPLNLSFPLFVQNLVSWVPRSQMIGEDSVPTGSPLALMPNPQLASVTITRPDGQTRKVSLDPLRPVFFSETDLAGVYRVERGNDIEYHAVNLLDRNESALTPADTLQMGQAEVEGQRGRIKQTRELWRWLLAGALVVLALEWWIYSRRVWV